MRPDIFYDPARTEPYTPAEVCAIARDAFGMGVDAVGRYVVCGGLGNGWPGTNAIHARAVDLFPAPMEERRREMPDPHDPRAMWSWYPGLSEFGVAHPEISDGDSYSPDYSRWQPTPERVALWLDLLKNPTERVPADAPARGE